MLLRPKWHNSCTVSIKRSSKLTDTVYESWHKAHQNFHQIRKTNYTAITVFAIPRVSFQLHCLVFKNNAAGRLHGIWQKQNSYQKTIFCEILFIIIKVKECHWCVPDWCHYQCISVHREIRSYSKTQWQVYTGHDIKVNPAEKNATCSLKRIFWKLFCEIRKRFVFA